MFFLPTGDKLNNLGPRMLISFSRCVQVAPQLLMRVIVNSLTHLSLQHGIILVYKSRRRLSTINHVYIKPFLSKQLLKKQFDWPSRFANILVFNQANENRNKSLHTFLFQRFLLPYRMSLIRNSIQLGWGQVSRYATSLVLRMSSIKGIIIPAEATAVLLCSPTVRSADMITH